MIRGPCFAPTLSRHFQPITGAGHMGDSKAARDIRVVVMGAGMAGILSGIKLLEAGITNCAIYEKADRVGGTWRENTYPGPDLRRALARLHLLLRTEPRLEPHAAAGRRDPGVLRAHHAQVRRRQADPLQRGDRALRIPGRTLAPRNEERHPGRSRHRDRRHRRPAPSQLPRHSRALPASGARASTPRAGITACRSTVAASA